MHEQTRTATMEVRPPGRDGVRELLRRPTVRLLLALTGVGQLVAVQGIHQARPGGEAVRLEPVVVRERAAPAVHAAAPRGTEAEVRKLAARYREKGFSVPLDLARDIHAAALEHGVDPEVAFGLVRAESSFRNAATSHVGAIGLTQLMPNTARWLEPGVTRAQLRNPETNLRIGMRYLRQLIDKYDGDTEMALTAYNRGPGTVDRVLRRGGNPDNGYADMVLGE